MLSIHCFPGSISQTDYAIPIIFSRSVHFH